MGQHRRDELLREIVLQVHSGQVVYPRTLRLHFGRRKWNIHDGDVASLRTLLSDDDAVRQRLSSPAFRDLIVGTDDGSLLRRQLSNEERRRAIVDVNNVVWTLRSAAPSIASIDEVLRYLRERGVTSIIGVADANVRYVVADPDRIDDVVSRFDDFVYAESGTPADERIIEIAAGIPSFIVSNDRFREYRKRNGRPRSNLWRVLATIKRTEEGVLQLTGAGNDLNEANDDDYENDEDKRAYDAT